MERPCVPEGDSLRRATLTRLAGELLRDYRATGDPKPLEEAIAFTREAIAVTPPGQSERPRLLSNLGSLVSLWHTLTGDP